MHGKVIWTNEKRSKKLIIHYLSRNKNIFVGNFIIQTEVKKNK